MKIQFMYIAPRRAGKSAEAAALTAAYLARASHYMAVMEQRADSEAEVLTSLDSPPARRPSHVLLAHPSGRQLSSEDFAALLGRLRDNGTQELVLAIGPADGWSAAARARADTLLSLGPMTLPHELARVVLAEQVYRALTILAGHPYHTGH